MRRTIRKQVEVWPPKESNIEKELVFPAAMELALYDKNRYRVTPWFPAREAYIGDDSTDRAIALFLGARLGGKDYDYFCMFNIYITTIRKGEELKFKPPESFVPPPEAT